VRHIGHEGQLRRHRVTPAHVERVVGRAVALAGQGLAHHLQRHLDLVGGVIGIIQPRAPAQRVGGARHQVAAVVVEALLRPRQVAAGVQRQRRRQLAADGEFQPARMAALTIGARGQQHVRRHEVAVVDDGVGVLAVVAAQIGFQAADPGLVADFERIGLGRLQVRVAREDVEFVAVGHVRIQVAGVGAADPARVGEAQVGVVADLVGGVGARNVVDVMVLRLDIAGDLVDVHVGVLGAQAGQRAPAFAQAHLVGAVQRVD
ncbi:conserved hypothetical protein, partial [Ricinus communis]